MAKITNRTDRPLSPHLQVYKLPMTALMSISHRITGVALSAGFVLVAAFFVLLMMGEAQYAAVMQYAGHPLVTAILMAWSFALYYHTFNGIRHLVWDTVHLLDQCKAVMAGWVVLLATVGATAATWYFATAA